MNIDVDIYTAKDGNSYLITLTRLRPSGTSGVNMDDYTEPPEKINGITDKVVLEAILGEDKCFRTSTKPTHELLTS